MKPRPAGGAGNHASLPARRGRPDMNPVRESVRVPAAGDVLDADMMRPEHARVGFGGPGPRSGQQIETFGPATRARAMSGLHWAECRVMTVAGDGASPSPGGVVALRACLRRGGCCFPGVLRCNGCMSSRYTPCGEDPPSPLSTTSPNTTPSNGAGVRGAAKLHGAPGRGSVRGARLVARPGCGRTMLGRCPFHGR